MSERTSTRMKETERIVAGPGPGRGPMGGGQVGQKAMTFGPSAKRLIGRMAPERTRAIAVILLAVASTTLMALGPRILGHATDLIFAGLFGRNLPHGVTPRSRRSRACAPAARTSSPTCSAAWTSCPARASTSPPSRTC